MTTNRGFQSTEFWMMAVTLAAILLQDRLGLVIPEDVQTWLIGSVTAYTAGRSGVKAVSENRSGK